LVNRLASLFQRFAAAHLDVVAPGPAITTAQGERVGYIDRIILRDSRLVVQGWAQADEVTLLLGGQRTSTCPHILRLDVFNATGIPPEVGFELALPLCAQDLFESDVPGLVIDAGSERLEMSLRIPGLAPAIRRCKLRFATALIRQLPAITGWIASRDVKYRKRIKAALDLGVTPTNRRLHARALFNRLPQPAGRDAPGVTVIMPVYNAFDITSEALDRVARGTDLPWRLIVVEDCSTDTRVRPFLREWASARREAGCEVIVIENPRNLGFVASVNAALERALPFGDDVVLLNSDVLLPEDWASRLLQPMRDMPEVASVTPMANDAEIFSAPAICAPTALEPGQAEAMDRLAQRLGLDGALAEAPTGIGFCMAMSIDHLRREPQFDTAFGRGYGEEVDWCQRSRRHGGRHMVTARLFVEHRGGESFGQDTKAQLVARNNAVIARRYPDYDAEVQDFIRTDPLLSARMMLAMAWAGTKGEVPVYLAHSMGGGAEDYLARHIRENLEQADLPSVVLRVGGAARWQIELHSNAGLLKAHTDDFDEVICVLDQIREKRIIYSCGVGDSNPADLPARLLRLAQAGGHPIEVLVHDFFALSPSYTLLDSDGVFRGTPDPETTDSAHHARLAGGRIMRLGDWRAAWRPLLDAAEHVTVFSQDSRRQVLAAYPEIEDRVRVLPHRLLNHVPTILPPRTDRRTIGVLGNIGHHKGAEILRDMARLLERTRDPGLVVIGTVDPAYALPG
jgi:GT2 family glycosyltransferase